MMFGVARAVAARAACSHQARRSAIGTLSSRTFAERSISTLRLSAQTHLVREQNVRVSYFSTKKVVHVRRSEQREVWDEYISGKSDAIHVFGEIDLNFNHSISVKEVKFFLDSVDRKGVSEGGLKYLEMLGDDHEMDHTEFNQWLNIATDVTPFVPPETPEPAAPPKAEETPKEDSKPKKKVVDARRGLQRLVWDTFLSTGKHGDELFKMIDLNKNRVISVFEISYFLESVGMAGVDQEEFDKLQALGADKELKEEEFLDWLNTAAHTKDSNYVSS